LFHDRARIHVVAGRGGDGALSFRREKHVPKGGPDGGDGGPGGDVVLVADPDLRDLSTYRSPRRYKAGKGRSGGGAGKHGASGGGVGLGHEFLAHLERARLLVHVIDAAAGDPAELYEAIRRELSAYGAGLDRLPEVVVLNKLDLLPEPPPFEPPVEVLRVFAVSCATGAGIEEFRRALFELCPAAPEPASEQPEALADFLVYRPKPDARRAYRILRTDRGYRVSGRPPAEEELERALRAAGVKKGDEVEVGDEVLEFR